MGIINLLLSLILSFGLSRSGYANDKPSKHEVAQNAVSFKERNFTSKELHMKNADFESFRLISDREVKFKEWENPSDVLQFFDIKQGKGYKSRTSIAIVAKPIVNENDQAGNLKTNSRGVMKRIDISSVLQSSIMNVSVSAWVWSDTPQSACLTMEANTGNKATSAFHTGKSRWEYLTLIYPFSERISNFNLFLSTENGIAKFDKIHAIVAEDDRFENTSDVQLDYRFREIVTFKKNKRIRIIVVGNSTIWGDGASKNGTFPYILQTKLESLYPGVFEVMNCGICGWNLPSQIVSLDRHFLFRRIGLNHVNVFDSGTDGEGKIFSHKDELVTLRSLEPDYIILSSMWNDIYGAIRHPDVDPLRGLTKGTSYASILYLKSIFNYVDRLDPENFYIADVLYNEFSKMPPITIPKTHQEYLSTADAEKLITFAEIKYGFLLRTFMEKSLSWVKIWNLTLPTRFGDRYNDMITSLRNANIIKDDMVEAYRTLAVIDNIAEKIQNKEIGAISEEYGQPFINLSGLFKENLEANSLSNLKQLSYFRNYSINDNIHLQYTGNEWLADNFFNQMKDEFERIVKERTTKRTNDEHTDD